MLLNNYARPCIREIPMIIEDDDNRPYLAPYRATPDDTLLFMRQWLAEAAYADKWSGWDWYRDICLANATGWASR